ncbi:MAG: sporulation integral membrane protein YtvI [Eubacterium sp.]|nr:sporulation integral membrane protein YtvI [Eubacterium sp.]
MTPKVEKKRAFLINFAFLALILGLVYIFFKHFFWVTAPFLLSFFFAVLLQKPLRWLDRKTKRKLHTFWSILLVVISISIILLPLAILITALVSQIINFVDYIQVQLEDFPQFIATAQGEILNFLKFLPEGIYDSVSNTVINAFDGAKNFDLGSLDINFGTITNTITSGASGVFSAVKGVPSAIIGLVIGIIAWILFTKDYDRIVRFIQLQLPEGKKNLLVEIKQVFSKTIFKMVRAYALIMFITFCELFIGFSILNLIGVMNNSYIFIIAMAIAIFDILPVAGSGGVLTPWAIISLISGNIGQAIGLIVIYVVITVIRQYIEPKIVGDSLGVNPLLTLAGLYFGLKLFGFMGMFIVPLMIMTLKAFNDTGRVSLWKSLEDR